MRRFIRFSFFAVLVLIPFGARKFIFDLSPQAGSREAVFLYAADIFVLLLAMTCVILSVSEGSPSVRFKDFSLRHFRDLDDKIIIFSILFIILVAISIFFAEPKILAVYSLVRFVLAVGLALAVVNILRRKIVIIDEVLGIFVLSAVVQSVIGIFQFAAQGSLGLRLLGESALRVGEAGVAAIKVSGVTILRAYGTFPHPNVLGAYLVLGLLACVYLLLRNTKSAPLAGRIRIYENSLVITGIFLIMLGLTLTFSRSAWLAAIFGLCLFVVLMCQRAEKDLGFMTALKKQRFFSVTQNDMAQMIVVLMLSVLAVFIILHPFILARSDFSGSEPAVADRIAYDRLGLEIIKERPFGVGIGNQQPYAVAHGLYEKFGLTKPWQKEPVHNLYLLIADEIGVLGLVVFLFLILVLPWKALSFRTAFAADLESSTTVTENHWNAFVMRRFVICAMLCALLIVGLFDHFLWDLPQGQLMLWVIIGMVMGLTNKE